MSKHMIIMSTRMPDLRACMFPTVHGFVAFTAWHFGISIFCCWLMQSFVELKRNAFEWPSACVVAEISIDGLSYGKYAHIHHTDCFAAGFWLTLCIVHRKYRFDNRHKNNRCIGWSFRWLQCEIIRSYAYYFTTYSEIAMITCSLQWNDLWSYETHRHIEHNLSQIFSWTLPSHCNISSKLCSPLEYRIDWALLLQNIFCNLEKHFIERNNGYFLLVASDLCSIIENNLFNEKSFWTLPMNGGHWIQLDFVSAIQIKIWFKSLSIASA